MVSLHLLVEINFSNVASLTLITLVNTVLTVTLIFNVIRITLYVAKPYKFGYDGEIIKILNYRGKLSYRKIKNELENNINKQLSFDTFNYHIRNLVDKNYIQPLNKFNTRRGEKLFYELSGHIKQEIRLGIFRITDNRIVTKQANDERDLLKHMYYVIFYVIAVKPSPIEVDEEYQNNEGVSVEDLTKEYSSVLGYFYLKLTKRSVKRVLKALEHEGLIQKQKCPKSNVIRYVVNSMFGQLLQDCITTFQHDIVLRYNYLWRVRPSKRHEKDIMKVIWDEEYLNEQIIDFQKQRKANKLSSEYRELRKKHSEWVDILDYNIFNSYKNIKITYSQLFENYPVISNQIMKVYFPEFLIKEIQDIDKKYKGKKFPISLKSTFTYQVVLSDFFVC